MKCGVLGETKCEKADFCCSIFLSLHLHSLLGIQTVNEPDLIGMELNVNFATKGV